MSSLFQNLWSGISGKGKGHKSKTWTGRIKKDSLIKDCRFVVFDTELSGLDPKKDFIVSIGALKMNGNVIHIGSEFNRLIRPEGKMTKKSVEIHGIMPGELEAGSSIEEVLPEFLHYITDSVLVGHFVHIDMKFLKAGLKRMGYGAIVNPALDTHGIHEWLRENSTSFRKHYRGGTGKTDLFTVAHSYGIDVETAHNAVNDAFITAQLFQKFLCFLDAEGMRTLGELIDIGRA
jgi:DNA polymerase-3 subunit epsilon